MHVNTTKSRVVVDQSAEVKALEAKVETLTQRLEALEHPKPKTEPKPNA